MSSLDCKVSELFRVLKLDKASGAAVTFLKVFPLSAWYSRGTVSMGDHFRISASFVWEISSFCLKFLHFISFACGLF